MFELSEFYDYCRKHHVDVIPYTGCPQPGATVHDRGNYAIFLDFSQIPTTRMLRGVCCHELSHVATGALHKAASPYELVERSEYRANRYTAQTYLTVSAFREAFAAGCRELWQLAEYFDLPEQDIEKALTYWSERRNVHFTPPESDVCS